MENVITMVAAEFPEDVLPIIRTGVVEATRIWEEAMKVATLMYLMRDARYRYSQRQHRLPAPEEPAPAPETGVMPAPEYDFAGIQAKMRNHALFGNENLQVCLLREPLSLITVNFD
jgi:hypothetical protein